MRIRSAGIEELPEVQRIENSCFQEERYPTEVLAEMLEEEGFETFLAEDDELMGSATVNYRDDLIAAQLVSLAVLPRFRGKGIARALLAEAEARVRRRGAERMVLQVAVTNVAALNLYLHQGYVLQGVIGSYYGPGRTRTSWTRYCERPPLGGRPVRPPGGKAIYRHRSIRRAVIPCGCWPGEGRWKRPYAMLNSSRTTTTISREFRAR